MKKIKIAAAVVLAATIGAGTLAACGNGGLGADKFNIADYAHPLDSVYSQTNRTDYADTEAVKPAFTKLSKKDFKNISDCGDYTAVQRDSSLYDLYDLENDKVLLSGYAYIGSGYYNGVTYYRLEKNESGGQTTYQFAGPDGALLSTAAYAGTAGFYIEQVGVAQNIPETAQSVTYYKVTLPPQKLGEDGEVKYYSLIKKRGGLADEWKASTQAEAEAATAKEYSAGSKLGLRKTKIPVNSDLYPVNNYEGIEYSVTGSSAESTYTYYKDGEKISSVSVSQGEIVGYAGNYVYFLEIEYVSSDAQKGYNVEINSGSNSIKTNVKLYRYDFIHGKGLKEISTGDYVITGSRASLYNYSKDKYDAIAVTALKKVDGVAVASTYTNMVVLNENGKVIADLSGTDLAAYGNTDIYKLGEDSYFAGSYILDGKLNTLARLPSDSDNYIWADKGLIYAYYNGGALLVDYSGKIIISAPASSLFFYGDLAVNSVEDASMIYSATNSEGKAVTQIVPEGGDLVFTEAGFIIKRAYNSSGNYNYTLYDLNGNSLITFENLDYYGVNVVEYNGGYMVTVESISGVTEYYRVG